LGELLTYEPAAETFGARAKFAKRFRGESAADVETYGLAVSLGDELLETEVVPCPEYQLAGYTT
jgi:hypothetical protein